MANLKASTDCPVTARESGEIEGGIDLLRTQLGRIDLRLSDLEDRISVILASPYPADAYPKPETKSKLGEEIVSMNNQAESLIDKINSIIGRVQL